MRDSGPSLEALAGLRLWRLGRTDRELAASVVDEIWSVRASRTGVVAISAPQLNILIDIILGSNDCELHLPSAAAHAMCVVMKTNNQPQAHTRDESPKANTPKLIGAETLYLGTEISWAAGCRVRIRKVLSNCIGPNWEAENESDDEETILLEGGVTAYDRLEVDFRRADGVWLTRMAEYPRAVDLEIFADVRAEWIECLRESGR